MGYLIANRDDGKEARVAVEDSVEVGRDDDSWAVVLRKSDSIVDLHIEDATLSRNHARIYWQSGKLFIQDMGSKNGTYIGGTALSGWSPGNQSMPVEISGHSVVQFGYNTTVRIDRGIPSLSQKEWAQLTSKLSKGTIEKLANSFRLVLAIDNECCNTSTTVKDVNGRLENLKLHLISKEFVDEVEKFQRKLSAELYSGQLLSEEHAQELKNLCIHLSEMWCAKVPGK
ncbi:FHA domain-containing protein [Chloroflexota bacterium]